MAFQPSLFMYNSRAPDLHWGAGSSRALQLAASVASLPVVGQVASSSPALTEAEAVDLTRSSNGSSTTISDNQQTLSNALLFQQQIRRLLAGAAAAAAAAATSNNSKLQLQQQQQQFINNNNSINSIKLEAADEESADSDQSNSDQFDHDQYAAAVAASAASAAAAAAAMAAPTNQETMESENLKQDHQQPPQQHQVLLNPQRPLFMHHHNHHELGPVQKTDADDLDRIRNFIEQFKGRRGALGLTQKQAAQCFRAYTNDRYAFSDNFVGHFEGFQFRPQTAMTIADSLAEWLGFAENETRQGRQLSFMPGKVKETRKRKYEVIRIGDSAKRVLVEAFEKNKSPSTSELEQLSRKTNIPSRNIEIFFKNRRTSRQYHH